MNITLTVKSGRFSSQIRNKTTMSILTTSVNNALEVLARKINPKREIIKKIHLDWKEVKLYMQMTWCTLLLFSHSVVSNSLQPHGLQHARLQSFTISQSLLKLTSIESLMPPNHLILCCPLLLLPSVFPSIRVFSDESALHIRWAKYWNFSFSISPSNEYLGLISPLGLTGLMLYLENF